MEEWRPIPEFPGYEVSNRGEVRSLSRVVSRGEHEYTVPCRTLTQFKDSRGYLRVYPTNRHTSCRRVHRLVLSAFVGPCPEGMVPRWRDNDRTNNHLSNLRWAIAEAPDAQSR
jgi:hypothetical protein